MPNYPKSVILPHTSDESEDNHAGGCFKLVLKKPYHGNNYSVIFKPKTSLNDLYYVVTKLQLAKLHNSTIIFNFYYSIKKGNKIIMVVGMNTKAIKMVSNNKT